MPGLANDGAVVPAGEPLAMVNGGGMKRLSIVAAPDRERISNDVLNTSVMAALVGGFALGNLSAPSSESSFDVAIYMTSFIAVHACTCSALTSAFVYRTVNNMEDSHVEAWATKHGKIVL